MVRSLALASLLTASATGLFAQKRMPPPPRRDSIPYMFNNNLPAFNVLLRDSSGIFNTFNIPKGKPSVLLLFSPDCKHCNEFTGTLVRNIDSLKDVNIYMISMLQNITIMRNFIEAYDLDRYSNITVVGCDYEFFYLTYFAPMQLPAAAIFDADKKFIKLLDGTVSVNSLYMNTHPIN
jgi:hypothetical protein